MVVDTIFDIYIVLLDVTWKTRGHRGYSWGTGKECHII